MRSHWLAAMIMGLAVSPAMAEPAATIDDETVMATAIRLSDSQLDLIRGGGSGGSNTKGTGPRDKSNQIGGNNKWASDTYVRFCGRGGCKPN